MDNQILDYIRNCPLKNSEDNRIYKTQKEYEEQLNEPELLQGDMLMQQVDSLIKLMTLDENCELGLHPNVYLPILEYTQEVLRQYGADTYYPSVIDDEYVEVRTKGYCKEEE